MEDDDDAIPIHPATFPAQIAAGDEPVERRAARLEKYVLRLNAKIDTLTASQAAFSRRQRVLVGADELASDADIDRCVSARAGLLGYLDQKKTGAVGFGKWVLGGVGALLLTLLGALASGVINEMFKGHNP